MIGSTITRDEVVEKFPQMRTVPIVLIDGKLIGGYENLDELIKRGKIGRSEGADELGIQALQ